MRTSNPVLNEKVFAQAQTHGREGTMTVQGTVNKTFVLLFLLVLAAGWAWNKILGQREVIGESQAGAGADPSLIFPLIAGGSLIGFVVALVTVFKKDWSIVTAPIYAVCQGLFLGAISVLFEFKYPGIVAQAVLLTFATLFCLLMGYKSGLIKATENFKLGVFAATSAVALIYFLSFILGLFRVNIPYIHESGILGIGFSLFVVTVAALNLVLDFDFIENGAARGAPKYMEWFGGFGLIVTLVWLYIEFLKLLAKLRDRR